MDGLRQGTDLVQHSQITGGFNFVYDIIQPCGEHRDVFPIERCNEARVQCPHDVVGHLIPYMLQIPQLSGQGRPPVGGAFISSLSTSAASRVLLAATVNMS